MYLQKLFLIILAFLLSMSLVQASEDTQAIYVITNKAGTNSIMGYNRLPDGTFTRIGEFFTGGKGTGDLEVPALKKDATHPLLNGDDPLISANAIAATADGQYVVAVNPGNSTLSLMKRNSDMTLKHINTVPTSDRFPVSVAIYDDLVVAASIGLDNMNGSISAFKISNGKLSTVEKSRRDLKARPSTIAFSSDGEHVILDELVTGKIKVYGITSGTISENPTSEIDSPRSSPDRFQAIPVGLIVRGNGGDDILVVSEARFLTPDFKLREDKGKVPQTPLYSWQTGSLSTYRVTDEGQISIVSADVLTGNAVEGGEIAICWVVFSDDGNIVYGANALSSSISTFNVEQNGNATLRNQTAYKDADELLFFSDLAISGNGQELYQLVGNTGEVMIFDIVQNGDLKLRQTIGGLPKLGSYGMLVL